MRMFLVILSLCCSIVAADEPTEFDKLKAKMALEQAEALLPLYESYHRALKRLEVQYTKEGDLDNALKTRKEFDHYSKGIEALKLDAGLITETEPVTKDDAMAYRVVSKETPSKSNVWGKKIGMKLAKPFRTAVVRVLADGPSQGEMVLQLPDKTLKSIYTWTGKEPELRQRKKVIKTEDDIKPLKIDVSEFTTLSGTYVLHYIWKGGEALKIYGARMDY